MKGCSRKSSDLGGKKGYGVVVLDALNERLLPKEQRPFFDRLTMVHGMFGPQ